MDDRGDVDGDGDGDGDDEDVDDADDEIVGVSVGDCEQCFFLILLMSSS